MPSLEDLSVDQLLNEAKKFQGAYNLLDALQKNPETRGMLQAALKKNDPKLAIPEVDIPAALEKRLAEEREAREKLEAKIREDEIRGRLERQRAGVMSKYGLSEADLAEVEKLMTDKDNPIPTYEAAARVFKAEKQTAAPTPTSYAPPTFEMPDKDVWKGGIGNPANLNKIALNEAFKAFNEIRGGKVAGLGPATSN